MISKWKGPRSTNLVSILSKQMTLSQPWTLGEHGSPPYAQHTAPDTNYLHILNRSLYKTELFKITQFFALYPVKIVDSDQVMDLVVR